MKIAILADLHQTSWNNLLKKRILEWAIREAEAEKVDLIVGIGDLTAQGTEESCREVLEKFAHTVIPCAFTPGNAELRSSYAEAAVKAFTKDAPENIPVILVDSSRRNPDADEIEKIRRLPDNAACLLATHVPPARWNEQEQCVLQQAIARRAVTAVTAGHSHCDTAEIVRGMDPDKASGGVPMIAIAEQQADGSWQRRDVAVSNVDPGEWKKSLLAEFRSNIGFSTMREHAAALDFAIKNQVPVLELRHPVVYSGELVEAIARWRDVGGRVLSMHLPNLVLNDSDGVLKNYAKLACQLGCDRVTLHTPKITADLFEENSARIFQRFEEDMQELLNNNVTIGIENLHTYPGKESDDLRNYGCNISECRFYVETLRQKFGSSIGYHLDIGHARNNAPFSASDNVSDYYCNFGQLINGYHLHQVAHIDNQYINHYPLTAFYDKLISLAGLFMAYEQGIVRRDAAMIIEARTLAGCMESYSQLMKLLQ